MKLEQFERLKGLHGKRIDSDIRFENDSRTAYAQTFRDVFILNEDGWPVRLHGSYRQKTNTVVFVVVLDGVGPICRVCVRGQVHRDCGRTHKHSLHTENCPRQNLAVDVVARPDLEEATAREIFRDFCARARIRHNGHFYDPEDA